MRDFFTRCALVAPVIFVPVAADAAVPSVPSEIQALPAADPATKQPAHPVRQVVEDALAEVRDLSACNDDGLKNVQSRLNSLQSAVNKLVRSGGGNKRQRALAQRGLAKLKKQLAQHRLDQQEECRKITAKRVAQDKEFERQREINKCLKETTFPKFRDPSGLKNGNLRFAMAVLKRSAEAARAKCDVAALQRLADQADNLAKNQLRKIEQLKAAVAKKAKASAADEARDLALRLDGLELIQFSALVKQSIRACAKRKKINVPGSATGEPLKKLVTAAVDRKIAAEAAKSKKGSDGVPNRGRQRNRQDAGDAKPEQKKKSRKNAGIGTNSADRIARTDPPRSRISVTFNAGFRSQGSTNNSATTVQQGGNIVGSGTTGSSRGFSTNLDVEFRVTKDTILAFNFETFQGSGTSSSTDPGATGYIPYVNGNPLVGLGQTGLNAQTSVETFMKQLDLDLQFALLGIPGLDDLNIPFGAFNPQRDMLAAHNALHRSGGGGITSAWKFGLFGGVGLRVQHTSLNEHIGANALTVSADHHTKLQTRTTFIGPKFTLGLKAARPLGRGTLFGALVGVFAPGVSVVDGRADQTIQVQGARANPSRSMHGSRGNFQTTIAATLGYTFWGIRAGVTGSWSWEANRPFVRMPVATGGARIAYRPAHSFAVKAFVNIPLY